MLPRGPITHATVRTSAVHSLKFVAQAATLILLAYLLGPADFGAFAAVASLAVLHGALATFGTHVTLLRDLTRDPGVRDQTLPTALGTTATCGAVLAFTYLFLASVLLQKVEVNALVIISVGLTEILVQPFLLLSATQRHATGRIARSQLLMTLPILLRMITLVAIWTAGTTEPLSIYAVGHLASSVVALTLSLLALDRSWPPIRSWRPPNLSQLRDSLGFALITLTANSPSEIDKIVAARMLPLSAAGIYAAASRMIGASVIPVLSLMVSALPRLFLQSDDHRLRLLRWLLGVTFMYGMTAFAILHITAPVVEWVFGPLFLGVSDTIRLLAFAVLPMSLRITATNVLMTSGSPWFRAGTEAAGTALLLLLALGLTPPLATTGIIVAVTITESAMATIAWVWAFRSYRSTA